MQPIKYSVVIPVKNEIENMPPLLEEVFNAMQSMKQNWELILVDDGSTDGTLEYLQKQKKHYPQLLIISFDRNYGQTSAFDAGFKLACGQWVITLDGDGQNDPADIPKLCTLEDNFDLVCGLRVIRNDSWLKKACSKLANIIRGKMLGDNIADTGCSLKLFRKTALAQIPLYHGMHRFFPALFKIYGFKVGSMPVNHRHRLRGKSKYHLFNRFLGPIVDLLAVYWMANRRLRYQIKLGDET